MEIPTGTPGVGTTYTIPAGNLFAEAEDTDNKTRPEIFGMGFRNPFRFTVDPETGWVLRRDYGPDASTTNANRGPQGSVEYNVLTKAGNYGWPYCIRDNTPYNDYDFATSHVGRQVRLRRAGQQLAQQHRPAPTCRRRSAPAPGWATPRRTRASPGLGTGGAPMGGPRYHYDANLVSPRKFPAFYDDKWFIAEWNNGWIKTADLNATGAMTGRAELRARHGLQAADGPRLRSRRRAVRDRVGLGLQRRQRRLGRLPHRLHLGREGPDRARHRHADRRASRR